MDGIYGRKALELLWEQLADVPMNPETERIERRFFLFPAGTHREEIWHWFDERYSGGVAALMYGEEQRLENEVSKEKISHPSHYNTPGRKECIVEMEELFGAEAVYWFCRLNDYKYKYRGGSKEGNSAEQDSAKAEWYADYGAKMQDKADRTNLDRIRHMDSATLAAFLDMVTEACSGRSDCENCPIWDCGDKSGCDATRIKAWLDMSREEDER